MPVSIETCAADESQLELPFTPPLPPCSPAEASCRALSMIDNPVPAKPLPPEVQAIVDRFIDLP